MVWLLSLCNHLNEDLPVGTRKNAVVNSGFPRARQASLGIGFSFFLNRMTVEDSLPRPPQTTTENSAFFAFGGRKDCQRLRGFSGLQLPVQRSRVKNGC